ncbi:zinc transport system permease protein [Candidatus Termititenax persephonae]|uniref:Zinc transport system permease protein n=1 Tax=Candidatus Termititenax persephonae TaxID=2218525 RepID=A0A388TGE9_9BACT|nr:zinc transport system permease protein [Candidatus Termititenax persephonae]
MLNLLAEMFSYAFIVRATIVGLLVSLCAALLGVSLVLKRYSMIGDGLSHVGFGALAVASACHAAPLAVSVPVVLLAAILLLRLSENSKIKGDAAIALISTGALAVGVTVISLTTGMNTDVCNYLFGSILAMSRGDVHLSVGLALAVLVLFVCFYQKIFAVTFDENFARSAGVKTELYNVLLACLTAITIVLGMRMMGALLISSLVVFPALTAMRLCKKFQTVTLFAAVISAGCFLLGLLGSYLYATPTGASVVIVNIVLFLLCGCLGWLREKGWARAVPGLLIMLSFLTAADAKLVEIRENFFVTQTNEIYANALDYLGRTLKYEGIFSVYEDPDTQKKYYAVIRYGPGCCGTDLNAGFEVIWDKPYPETNAWVEAVGVLEEYDDSGIRALRLNLASLKILPTRGKERVLR